MDKVKEVSSEEQSSFDNMTNGENDSGMNVRTYNVQELMTMKKPDLNGVCEYFSVSKRGNKNDLIARILESQKKNVVC